MRLLLVRHAEAAPGDPDALRELTPAGEERAAELGMELAATGLRPDLILTSPLVRARQTAQAVARAVGAPVEIDERLGPGATADGVREAVEGRGDTVLTVGHQPDLPRIAAELTGGPPPDFPPAGLVAVDLA
jgi:phosphohistidine phosphatase